MKAAIVVAFLGALALALARPAHADPEQRVYAGVAMDTTVVTKIGYEHDLGAPAPWLSLAIPAGVTLPVLRPGGGDGELRAGVRADLRGGEHLRLRTTLQPFVRTTRNTIYDAVGAGVDLELAPSWVFGRGAVGLELGYDKSLADHLHHTDAYRSVYPGVVDGWYQGAAASLRTGVCAELRLGRVELRARAGRVTTETLRPEVLPFYLEVGAAIAM